MEGTGALYRRGDRRMVGWGCTGDNELLLILIVAGWGFEGGMVYLLGSNEWLLGCELLFLLLLVQLRRVRGELSWWE